MYKTKKEVLDFVTIQIPTAPRQVKAEYVWACHVVFLDREDHMFLEQIDDFRSMQRTHIKVFRKMWGHCKKGCRLVGAVFFHDVRQTQDGVAGVACGIRPLLKEEDQAYIPQITDTAIEWYNEFFPEDAKLKDQLTHEPNSEIATVVVVVGEEDAQTPDSTPTTTFAAAGAARRVNAPMRI